MRETRFAHSLSAVLDDAYALRVFTAWLREGAGAGLGSDGGRGESNDDATLLHFAIKSYKEKVSRGDSTAPGVACALHRRFISLRTGTCDFLPDEVRREVSQRVHAISASPPLDLFDPIADPLHRHLRAMHALFVCSQAFYHMQRELSRAESSSPSEEAPAVPPHQNRAYNNVDHHSRTSDPLPQAAFIPPKAKPRSTRVPIGQLPSWIARPTTSREFPTDTQRLHALSDSGGFRNQGPIKEEQPPAIRHEMPEGREAFMARVVEKLNHLLRENNNSNSLYRSRYGVDQGEEEVSTSDEEIDRYVDRIEEEEDEDSRRSKSVSPVVFAVRPARETVSTYGGVNGFAPPPSSSHSVPPYNFSSVPIPGALMTTGRPGRSRLETSSGAMRFSDSSGFCSAESAFLPPDTPSTSAYSAHKRRQHNLYENSMGAHTMIRRPQPASSTGYAQPQPFHPSYVTLPRRQKREDESKITLCLREKGQPAPLVAKIPAAEISLRDFRRTFGISSKSKKRLMFKSACEDGSAPYQWSLIMDDASVLPLFEGRITAECRGSISDSD